MIHFQNLGKQFSCRWALQDISGEIQSGSKVAVLGKNGAGKSTFLGLLAGFYIPTRGTLGFACKKNISFIGHESMFYSKLTALENLFFFQTLYPQSKKSDVLESLSLTDLYEFRNEKVETLSYGMKKRLNIARMLVQKPSVLILDEIVSGLDLKAKSFLKRILQDGGLKSINWSFDILVLVEHSMHQSFECCHEFWLLEKGKLKAKLSRKQYSLEEIRHRVVQVLEAR